MFSVPSVPDLHHDRGKNKQFDIAEEYMIGRTLDMRAAHANKKSGKYYGPHNIHAFIDKNIHVYIDMRDPQESTKPKMAEGGAA